jgi:hypothetical protein
MNVKQVVIDKIRNIAVLNFVNINLKYFFQIFLLKTGRGILSRLLRFVFIIFFNKGAL